MPRLEQPAGYSAYNGRELNIVRFHYSIVEYLFCGLFVHISSRRWMNIDYVPLKARDQQLDL